MALKDTIKHMKGLLSQITVDLDKSDNGNKAASQRVRTGTIRLEKIAKVYRKESIKTEKQTKGRKVVKKAPAKKPAKAKKATVKARHMSVKRRATAKLPSKKR